MATTGAVPSQDPKGALILYHSRGKLCMCISMVADLEASPDALAATIVQCACS